MARLAQSLSEYALPETTSAAFPRRKSILTFPMLIHGGSSINIVPNSCEPYGDVCLLPGLSVEDIRDIIRSQLHKLLIEQYQFDDVLTVPAIGLSQDKEIVKVLVEAAEIVTAIKLRVERAGSACDGRMFVKRGIPTVCGYGIAYGGVHRADEWVDLASLQSITEVYVRTILA